MKMTVEMRQRPQGDWFVRITSKGLAFAQIKPTREEAIRQVTRGVRWIERRAGR